MTMRNLFLLSLLVGSASFAASFAHAPAGLVATSLLAQASDSDDEDESEEASEEASEGAPASAQPAKEAPPASAMADESRVKKDTSAPSVKQKLVSGAPLFNPSVAVHIVQKKETSDATKYEAVLYPATAQVNGKFTQHFGTAASLIHHLHENFGLQLSGQYNWVSIESAFNQELIDKVRQEAQAASSLLMAWGVQGGVEVTPIYGKFAWYENNLFSFQVVINGGAGLASTRHQLKPLNDAGPATYGDTGMKFMGSLGAGFRLQFKERFAFRLEVRDLVYTARVDTVNGCDSVDLAAMDRATKLGNLNSASVAPSCQVEKFTANDASAQQRNADVTIAYNLVRNPSSDVLNNVGVYAGLAFLF